MVALTRDLAVAGYDGDGRVVYWGAGAEALFGHPAWEATRQSFDSLHGAETFERYLAGEECERCEIDPAGPPDVRHMLLPATLHNGARREFRITTMRAAEEDAPVQWWALYRDASGPGGVRTANASALPGTPGTPGEQDRLRELVLNTIEALRNGLCLVEMRQNRIVFANDSFLRITGFTRLELIGNTFDCVLTEYPQWREVLLAHLEDLKIQGEDAGTAHWDVGLPAGRRTLEVYGRPVFPKEVEPNFLLLIVDDITEKQALSNQLVQSEKLAAIGQLAAGIAHEMRSPLAAIYNAIYDLNHLVDRTNADIREDIDIASEEIRRVQEIINNLLDFARESGRDGDTADINEGVARTLRVIHKDLSNRRIEIVTDYGDGLPHGCISPNALKQVLINLFTNAGHAMAGGGTLTVRTRLKRGPVSIGSINRQPGVHVPDAPEADKPGRAKTPRASTKNHIVIDVSDTGCGIAPEALPMIFNPFFTTKPSGIGTGLGLSVVHGQIRERGGLIYVKSRPKRGTTFTIHLPAAEPDSA